MSTYVMSDLHGAFDSLMDMLVQIQFTQKDTSYILGDVVDRGPDGVKILQFVMQHPNIRMILGNHEYMCVQYFKEDADEKIKRQWNRNGNFPTLRGFDQISEEEKREILFYLAQLPSEYRITINDKKYILVHGFLGENAYRRVWNRPALDEKVQREENEMIIIGHTPVCEFVCPGTDEEMYVYSHELTKKGDHFKILYAPDFIDVDCCVGYGLSAARLACLRLEDGAEFYEKVAK